MADTISPDIWDGRAQCYRPAPDWRARLSSRLDLHEDAAEELDPVTYEVIRHRLWTINTAHGETVTRISGSPVFATLDFNMCIMTEQAEVVLNAPYLQYLDAGAPLAIRFMMEHYGEQPGINPGDMFLTNDPWVGAVHQLDVLIACPVFIEGKLFGWVSNAGHQYDLGGVSPGGWPQNAVDIYYDPIVLTPFKIVEEDQLRADLEQMYLRQSRMPDLVALDLRAQLAGARFAREEVVALCEKFGAATVKAAMNRILDASQQGFAEKVERIPDGEWSEVRYFDERLPGDRTTHRMQVNVTKTGDRIRVDNVGTQEQEEGPNGFTFTGFSGSVIGIVSPLMLYEQLFAIGGADRQLDYDPTPGLLSCVDYGAAVSGATMNILCHMSAFQTCLSRMLGCDSELERDIVAPHAEWPLVVISGHDDRGEYFGQALLDAYAMGSGARSYKDGIDTGGPIWSPLSFLLNVEALEQWYPIVFLYRKELVDGSGAGRWRGGTGMAVAFTPYRARSMEMITNTGGMGISTYGAEGLCGGYPSPTAHYLVLKGSDVDAHFARGEMPADVTTLAAESTDFLRAKSNGTALVPGDVVETTFCGGGGFGDPLEREPALVATDVAHGYTSAAAAREVYGIVIGDDGSADDAATGRERERLRGARAGWTAPSGEGGAQHKLDEDERAAARPFQSNLLLSDAGGHDVIACEQCGTVICDAVDNYKEHVLCDEGPVTLIPRVEDPHRFLDEDMVFRRYCCPGCQVMLTTQVVRASEPTLREVTLG